MKDQKISIISYSGELQLKSTYLASINKQSLMDLNFYYKFLEDNSLLQAQIQKFEVITDQRLFFNQYVVYDVRVITDHISYIVKRRYSQFSQIFNRLIKYYDFTSQFPKKTRLSSKISSQISIMRMADLNNFISQVLSLAEDNQMIVIEFLEFLDLKKQYKIHNLQDKIISRTTPKIDESQLTLSYCLSHEMLKLNRRRQQSLKYLQKIEELILHQQKSKLKMEDLKQVLFGNNNTIGLIELALTTDNQLVAISFLKTIHKFFNIEECCYSEAFKKIIETVSTKRLKIHDENMTDNPEFLNQYFKLIEVYIQSKLSTNQKVPVKVLLKEIMKQKLRKLYFQWKESSPHAQKIAKRSTSYDISRDIFWAKSIPLIKHSSFDRIDNQIEVDNDIDPLERFQLVQNQFKILHRNQFCRFQVSKNLKIVHIHIRAENLESEKWSLFQTWKYNKLITSSYKTKNSLSDIISLNVKVPRRQPKIFKLIKLSETQSFDKHKLAIGEQLMSHKSPKRSTQTMDSFNLSDKYYKIVYQPFKEEDDNRSREDGFFYSLQIAQKEENTFINISFHFHKEGTRKYFNSQLTGKTNALWDGIIEELYKKDKRSSSQSGNEDSNEVELDPISQKSSNIEVE